MLVNFLKKKSPIWVSRMVENALVFTELSTRTIHVSVSIEQTDRQQNQRNGYVNSISWLNPNGRTKSITHNSWNKILKWTYTHIYPTGTTPPLFVTTTDFNRSCGRCLSQMITMIVYRGTAEGGQQRQEHISNGGV